MKMIIQYDTRPNATIDEKIRSLIHSIQLALNEVESAGGSGSIKSGDINVVLQTLQRLSSELTSVLSTLDDLDGRVSDLEETSSEVTYDSLQDKPSIEGVTLQGNKTFPELNLDVLSNSDIQNIFDYLA